METITLNNGVDMPALGLGVFQTPPDETRAAVKAALGAEILSAAGLSGELSGVDTAMARASALH